MPRDSKTDSSDTCKTMDWEKSSNNICKTMEWEMSWRSHLFHFICPIKMNKTRSLITCTYFQKIYENSDILILIGTRQMKMKNSRFFIHIVISVRQCRPPLLFPPFGRPLFCWCTSVAEACSIYVCSSIFCVSSSTKTYIFFTWSSSSKIC